ncbi:PIN domain-containing protein [Methanobrevibacter curvatus]|uniref:PIN domain-containing protein n=1 Tax=Methanobrevibacter curvatus TaxID=49547 RepID=A0A166B323_9EURY|nr:hypothetical protein [Methanobrevibacter curvatus]KZX12806.1 hypothetical protein MBCUR_08620 [Methanobrevibacter curvatus]
MRTLANRCMAEKIATPKHYADALHIAIVMVIGVDVLVSWNFKHIINFSKIKLFSAVNIREGYNILKLRISQELINND